MSTTKLQHADNLFKLQPNRITILIFSVLNGFVPPVDVVRNSRAESNSSLVDALPNMANAAQIFNKDFLGIFSKKKNSCSIEGTQSYLSFRHFYFLSRASWTRTHWRLLQYSDTRGDVLGSGIQSSSSMKPGLMILLKFRMRYRDPLGINSVIPIMSPCLFLIFLITPCFLLYKFLIYWNQLLLRKFSVLLRECSTLLDEKNTCLFFI